MALTNQSERTKEVYSFLWSQGKSCLPLECWHFNDMQEMVSESMVRGTIGFEAGSGNGYDTNIMARNNPQVKIVSLDFSDGVYESKKINSLLKSFATVEKARLIFFKKTDSKR
jgi:hypothetical protein